MSQSKIHRRLSLPRGTETLLLTEATRHRDCTLSLENLFRRWGYLPTETPLVDYYEAYRPLLSEARTRDSYRTFDRAGELLMIRSDTTVFLAKQLGVHLRTEELPVRVYYNEQILRHEGEHDISRNEFHQSGVELVGVPGSDGDVEILLLLLEALKSIGAEKKAVLHLGSHRILDALISLGIPRDEYAALRRAIRLRRREEFRSILTTAGIIDDTDMVEELIFTIGSPESLTSIAGRLSESFQNIMEELRRIVDTVSELAAGTLIRIDLSELGSHDYYTGIAFSAYTAGVDSAVARGGRYDTLLEGFGCDAPSVGFSIYTRKLWNELPTTSGGDGSLPSIPQAAGATLVERYRNAAKRREEGERVRL